MILYNLTNTKLTLKEGKRIQEELMDEREKNLILVVVLMPSALDYRWINVLASLYWLGVKLD